MSPLVLAPERLCEGCMGTGFYEARRRQYNAIVRERRQSKRRSMRAVRVRKRRLAKPSVYFVQCRDRIKIGYSGDVTKRMSSLATGSADPMTLLATLPGPPSLEGEMHKRFAAHRLRGEWFRRGPDLVAFIGSINPES